MSMNTYGGMMTGLFIGEDYIDRFIQRYIENNPKDFQDIDDPKEAVWEWLECHEDLTSSGSGRFRASTLDGDSVYYPRAYFYPLKGIAEEIILGSPGDIFIEAGNWLTTKSVLEGNFYESKEDLIGEMKSKVGGYLPDDFDYEANIGDLEYAVFC